MSRCLAARWNGALVDGDRIAIAATDRGLTLGDGLFETLPVLNGVPVWLDQHLDRMMAAAATLGIPIPRAAIETQVRELIAGQTHGILRITLTRGSAGRGLGRDAGEPPGLLLTLSAWTPGLVGAEMTVHVATVRRNEGSPATRMKTLSYMDNILAAREAAAAGADEALMLNNAGNLACFSAGNVVLRLRGELVTPPLSDGALPGIVRARMIARHGLAERSLTRQDWDEAPAAVLVNSLRLVRPASGRGAEPSLLDKLCRESAETAGIDPRGV